MRFNIIFAGALALFSTTESAGILSLPKWINKQIFIGEDRQGSLSVARGYEDHCDEYINAADYGYDLRDDPVEDAIDARYYNKHGYHIGDGPAEYSTWGGGKWGDGYTGPDDLFNDQAYYGPPGDIVEYHEDC
ncbi:hypothetical protein PgNI_06653 [Pyricularia grisea]|uniref:Uncharacterized protein n=1 Tax=Pyricularia grisea TaxID=148305 RepID=A0A6P8B3K7_PYRGI|nr:hypothetical protein PgNI_06653 [Pyricularia grisea]TLD09926.1 hypothetical protein PgNI_06653 [Pyricularia grisea]